VSNDGLVLLRRSASRRPLFSGLEREFPVELDERDSRLLRAFRQRYERLVTASARLSLERLCEAIVAEHDYDLAVLALWDGKRRYANMRKLARLARSYEELRGADIEGFVRFVRQQEAVGAKELEAVAEEEGADAVRLLTIHSAKGLEFKVVVVADAGRDRAAPASDEILALSDGRFGFRVADPLTSARKGAFAWEEVREERRREDEAERLRLYYVAMTRAIDRLIVSGAIDPNRESERSTPLGWALGRLDAAHDLAGADGSPVELVRDDARFLLRVDRFAAEEATVAIEEPAAEEGQLALFGEIPVGPALRAPTLPALEPVPIPPIHRARRLSFTALSLFERCSYRYFAERVAGMRERDASGGVPGADGLGATELGSAVHAVLERLDLRAPAVPDDLEEQVRAEWPAASDEDVDRIHGHVTAYCDSELAARVARLEGVAPERHFTFLHDDVLLHGFLDVFHSDGSRALVVDYKTNALDGTEPAAVVDSDYRLQRLVYALASLRTGVEEAEVVYQFLERPGEPVSSVFTRAEVAELEAELSAAIERIQAGEFRPTPSESVCSGCPALNVVCAGPSLGGGGWAAEPAEFASAAAGGA
jgi:ATP-dependent exoDNAse (exonuclease V) beta subunit